MTPAEKEYKDIINLSWRDEVTKSDHAFFRKHPPMTPDNRAKIFAPFAALRGHSERLAEETGKLMRTRRIDLSDDEAEILSNKLVQVQRGMNITVIYFEPDADPNPGNNTGAVGYYISVSGIVDTVDPVCRILKIDTRAQNNADPQIPTTNDKDTIIRFDDITDISGPEIINVDFLLD